MNWLVQGSYEHQTQQKGRAGQTVARPPPFQWQKAFTSVLLVKPGYWQIQLYIFSTFYPALTERETHCLSDPKCYLKFNQLVNYIRQ